MSTARDRWAMSAYRGARSLQEMRWPKDGETRLRDYCGDRHWYWPPPVEGQTCMCGEEAWTLSERVTAHGESSDSSSTPDGGTGSASAGSPRSESVRDERDR
jgi:hypothetical protein